MDTDFSPDLKRKWARLNWKNGSKPVLAFNAEKDWIKSKKISFVII